MCISMSPAYRSLWALENKRTKDNQCDNNTLCVFSQSNKCHDCGWAIPKHQDHFTSWGILTQCVATMLFTNIVSAKYSHTYKLWLHAFLKPIWSTENKNVVYRDFYELSACCHEKTTGLGIRTSRLCSNFCH